MLTVGLLGIVVAVCTLGLGMLAYWPFAALVTAVAYLTISGQSTVADSQIM